MTVMCGSCEAPISEEMARTIRRLLGSLDPARHGHLAMLHGGTAPELLCASCFDATLSVVNASAPSPVG